MALTKLYTAIYVVLSVSATIQVLVEFAGLSYWLALGVIMALPAARAVLVTAYLQHLQFEPWSLMYLVYIGLVAALVLTLVASYPLLRPCEPTPIPAGVPAKPSSRSTTFRCFRSLSALA